jgi:hypothetical protein
VKEDARAGTPDGALLYCIDSRLTFLHRNPSGHTSQEGEIFLFSQEHHTFFGQPTSPVTTLATTAWMPL